MKNRTHQTSRPTSDKKKDFWKIVIPNTVEDQVKAERRARREAEIAAGHVGLGGKGGVHGGNKRDQRRKERRKVDREMRRGDYE